jgi:hypothetical protein
MTVRPAARNSAADLPESDFPDSRPARFSHTFKLKAAELKR